jgi:hypothetical protein
MMKQLISYGILFLVILAQPLSILAQRPDSTIGNVEIVQDSRVDLLVNKHIRINQTMNTMDGFRIQLFSDSGNNSKTKAQAVHDEFLSKYPEIGVYLTFKSPNYRVRIGNYRTKLDAQRFLIELAVDYPNAFIITDQINLPKAD